MDAAALAELAASIREHGVLEPILVRKRPSGGFEIIAGERRWRAAQQAGLKEVPIFLHDLDDEAAFEAALVENLQREDLNPMETARAFGRFSAWSTTTGTRRKRSPRRSGRSARPSPTRCGS
jgi:ParB family chromosome partitioning protein